jgi:hydroxyacylglutathione hydrolase
MTNVWRDHQNGLEFEIYQIPCLKNSFTYLVASHQVAISIDPGEGSVIQKELQDHDLKLETILLTHHHKAHVEDALFLKTKTDATIIGPKHEELLFVDQEVMDEDEFLIGSFIVKVMSLPGHTKDHVGYYFPDCKALFSGDALYLSGCGKMLEGDEKEYFDSLQKIKKLPGDTLIFGGHHITVESARTLEEEMKINPFLQVRSPEEFLKLRNEVDAS